MQIIDLHCDVLYKLAEAEEPLSFRNSEKLDVTLENLKAGNVKVQVFAIFIDDQLSATQRYMEALRQLEKFQYEVIAPFEEMVHITDWKQLDDELEEDQIGAILSLEGCDAIGEDMMKLQTFIDAGILLCGLTWNHENAVAYGAQEDATKGLKPFGFEVVEKLNHHNIIIDVSHLNEQGFWDVLPKAKYSLASHSNAYALRAHPRNLTDKQLQALAARGGHVHSVFYPLFVADKEQVELDDLIAHIKHMADLIGVDKLGLGSDFDGIDVKIKALENASKTPALLEKLVNYYPVEEVEGIAMHNFMRFVRNIKA
ncbi:MAG: membrane dipeptidase [Kurthia sp.]|nr:membrane dipeptidase [Candidatus Kurthia equi]